ncbi:hypothetical protein ILYODFUR_023260 [Ilyodon furcidens]|uniref:Uncharacterized protein n=1 Tax=Ilyodon furcidens TaxID=33524 RepID=A0ABV0U7R2_9TELE
MKHRSHNRSPGPTPRWDKLTRQEVPGQRVSGPPAGYPGRAGQPLQAKHNSPAAPVLAQDMLHRPTHSTANLSPSPGREPEGSIGRRPPHHAKDRAPTTKPWRCPRMPATHPPTQYTPLYPAAPSRLASPSTKVKPHLNQHCTPSPEPSTPPANRPGTKARD